MLLWLLLIAVLHKSVSQHFMLESIAGVSNSAHANVQPLVTNPSAVPFCKKDGIL